MWSEWTAWSSCSASCGINGREVRQRNCSNPAPSNGGKDCSGDAQEERACQQTPNCPGEEGVMIHIVIATISDVTVASSFMNDSSRIMRDPKSVDLSRPCHCSHY